MKTKRPLSRKELKTQRAIAIELCEMTVRPAVEKLSKRFGWKDPIGEEHSSTQFLVCCGPTSLPRRDMLFVRVQVSFGIPSLIIAEVDVCHAQEILPDEFRLDDGCQPIYQISHEFSLPLARRSFEKWMDAAGRECEKAIKQELNPR